MANIKEIIECLDSWMEANHVSSLTPLEANEILEREGLLKDRLDRPGKYIRDILRSGGIPHAYQDVSKRWHIPHSSSTDSCLPSSVMNYHEIKQSDIISGSLSPDELMEEQRFTNVRELSSSDIPNKPGLYAIRIDDIDCLPDVLSEELKRRGHNILYIGIASQSLRRRFWDQELHLKNNATFFRSMGAILGYRPQKGSLSLGSRNYKFSKEDTMGIICWMEEHLLVNYVVNDGSLENTLSH